MRSIIENTVSLILRYNIRFDSIKVLEKKNIYMCVVALLYGISVSCRVRGNAAFCFSDSEFRKGRVKTIF